MTEVALAVSGCPVCHSPICLRIAADAHVRWTQAQTRRARFFHQPDRFALNTVDPATVCQTTRKPYPSRPSAGTGRRGRTNQAGSNAPAGE